MTVNINSTLLVSDLDGTLLNSSQNISLENKEAIARFQAEGGKFTIATGRMKEAALPYAKELNVNIPIILYNGAVVYDHINNKNIYFKTLNNPRELLSIIHPLIKTNNLGLMMYDESNVYALNRNNIVENYEEKEKIKCNNFSHDVFKNSILKFLFISNDITLLESIKKKIQLSNYPCELIYSETNYLEVIPADTSKGIALSNLIINKGWESMSKICVGDNYNDLSLLIAADYAFYVENAVEEIKRKEFKTCNHHEQHAIKDIIDSFIFSNVSGFNCIE